MRGLTGLIAALPLLAAVDQDVWLASIQPFTGADWDAGLSMRIGAEIMLEQINSHPTLLQGFKLKVVWQDGLCAKPVGTNIFLQNIFDKTYSVFAPGVALSALDANKDGRVTTADVAQFKKQWTSTEVSPDPVGLLGSGCAGTAINIVNVAYRARFPMVSNSATRPSLSDRSAFPNFFRTILPDTFFNDAWLAMAKMLGRKSVVAVIGETENWSSMGIRFATLAKQQGITLLGNDMNKEMAGFSGLQISIESQSAAKDIAKELVRLKQRTVILMMFGKRNRLVLCEAYKQKFFNAVYMVMGWLSFGWWAVADNTCTPAQVTSMANYYIGANMMFWRSDETTVLSCSQSMNTAQFRAEWYKRQGKAEGDLSMTTLGFVPAKEASTTADAVCMYAQMLHQILVVQKSATLTDLSARTKSAYAEAFKYLTAADFEGVQGRVRYAPNSADPKGNIIVEQLQIVSGSAKVVEIGSYNEGVFNFLGKSRLMFQFPGENFAAGPAGANTIVAPLTPFTNCTKGKTVVFADNTCVACSPGMVYLDAVGICACAKGYSSQQAKNGAKCGACAPGTFSKVPGQLTCTKCQTGKYQNATGSSECKWCEVGYYSKVEGSASCKLFVRTIWLTAIQPFTGADWDAGISMAVGGKIMLEEINKHTSLLKGFELKVLWQDGLCGKPHGTKLFLTNIFDKKYDEFAPGVNLSGLDVDKSGTVTTSDTVGLNRWVNASEITPDPVGLLGSGCAGTAIAITNIAYMARYPMVSNSATRPGLSDRSKHPNFFRTIMPDTTFNPAWIAMSKMLGQTEIAVAIAETENWKSMGVIIGQAAKAAGVKLLGVDLSKEIPGFNGLQVSIQSQAGAKSVGMELVRLKPRVVVLLMFAPRARLVLCEAYKLNFRNAIFMPMGWMSDGWWSSVVKGEHTCKPEEVTSMAHYFISANMLLFRADSQSSLSCSEKLTTDSFKAEWFKRQGAPPGDLSMRPEGYALATEAASTADAACMWAKALHHVLIDLKMPLEHLAKRTAPAYDAIQKALTDTDFEGVQGRVKYGPGQPDPQGSVILEQMVPTTPAGGRRLATLHKKVAIAGYQNGKLSFYGNRLKFQFPGEDYLAGPKGANTITAPLTTFKVCSNDMSLDMLTNDCKPCPAGQVFLSIVGVCACKAGFVYDDLTSKCVGCRPGTFTGSAGKNSCENCTTGTFAKDIAATECIACGLGEYQNVITSSACKSCPAGETTIMTALKSNSGCGCKQGMYRPVVSSPGSCVFPRTRIDPKSKKTVATFCPACEACLEGMDCKFGSDANNFKTRGGTGKLIPLLSTGYYSEFEKPLSIYHCITKGACPGGAAGTCTGLREGLVCAICPTSFGMNKKTGGCDKCSGGLIALVGFSPIFIILAIFITYYIGNSPLGTNASITLTVSVAGGLIVTVLQVLAVFKQLNVPWPNVVLGVFDVSNVFALNADAVSIECAFGTDATLLYLFRILVPIAFVILVFFIFTMTKVVALIVVAFRAWVLDKALNTIGQVLQMLFIAFAVIVVKPLECVAHPNDTASMFLFPQVLCWSSEHAPLLVLAVLETVFFLAPYAGLCVWANVRAPRMSAEVSSATGQNHFLVRFRFLMYRFRPDTWWWGNVYLARQTLLAFSSSMPAADPHTQIIYTITVLAVYLAFLTRYWPWKNAALNLLDAGTTLMMLLVISAATAFLPQSPSSGTHVGFLVTMIGALGAWVVGFIAMVTYKIIKSGMTGEFGGDAIGNFDAKLITKKWLQANEVLSSLGHSRCEPMISLMNTYDREVILKSLVIWEITCAEFLTVDQMHRFSVGGEKKHTRLAKLQNSTAHIDVKDLTEKMHQCELNGEKPPPPPPQYEDVFKAGDVPSKPSTIATNSGSSSSEPAAESEWAPAQEGNRWQMDATMHSSLFFPGTKCVTTPRGCMDATTPRPANGLAAPATPLTSPRFGAPATPLTSPRFTPR